MKRNPYCNGFTKTRRLKETTINMEDDIDDGIRDDGNDDENDDGNDDENDDDTQEDVDDVVDEEKHDDPQEDVDDDVDDENDNPLHDYIVNRNYEKKTFDALLQKQNSSTRGNSLRQLGQHGVGYICLRHSVNATIESLQDLQLLLRKADNKVFRDKYTDSSDPNRLQFTTTYGNTLTEIKQINEQTDKIGEVLSETRLEIIDTTMNSLHDFVKDQKFFK